jgi:putative Holliday junction resolvase
MRSLGLDIGDKRIGVAVSDTHGILASPLTIINRVDESRDIEAIIDIIGRQDVAQVIVGLPRSMDGSLGSQAEKVEAFTRKLVSRIRVHVEYRDERLTTVMAERLRRAVKSKKTRRKARDDAQAAALILQSYLDEGP